MFYFYVCVPLCGHPVYPVQFVLNLTMTNETNPIYFDLAKTQTGPNRVPLET